MGGGLARRGSSGPRGPDLLAYRAADVSAANAAAGVRIRPAVRLRAVPPSGITGAAFRNGRLLLAGQAAGPLQLWSVDVRTGARELEAELPVSGESEGLDVVDDGHGLVHWIVTPFDPAAAADVRDRPRRAAVVRPRRGLAAAHDRRAGAAAGRAGGDALACA